MKHESISAAHPYQRLSQLGGFDVASKNPDPRGWTVVNNEGRSIGEVKDLIVDTERMMAAYLDVELDTKVFELKSDPHVLVPIHHAHRDGDHRRVRIDGLTRDRVAGLTLAREQHERAFWDQWWEHADSRTHVHDTASPRAYDAAGASSDDLRRAVEGIRPGETMRIPVVSEEIVVERRPVSPPASSASEYPEAHDREHDLRPPAYGHDQTDYPDDSMAPRPGRRDRL